ncbi:hypothetical protein [Paraflavitalea sp. CAU 1676]|uniref:hypothetical protein n=1 Tax=Paraflavitalea sp. CAU 1676 TaxID=3032598 RepID=UPI0023DB1944|nr:hypothetical protein [Paraflavitalea sp. CAU 1676]MDF2191375.1 hypothetical protein [Paraflavitalea sp. CAU 1676]
MQQNSANRILDALLTHAQQEIQYLLQNPYKAKDVRAAELTQQYYRDVLKTFRKKLTPQERQTKTYVRHQIRILNRQTRPGIITSLLYGRLPLFLRKIFRAVVIRNQHLLFRESVKATTRQSNINFLSDELKRMGFVHAIDGPLNKMMAQDLPRFHVRYCDVRNPNTDFILHFSKIHGTDQYKIDNFEASSKKASTFTRSSAEWVSFDQNRSASEAARLINGQAIPVADIPNQWLLLDRITKTLIPYQFYLESALRNLSFLNLNEQEIKSIQEILKATGEKEITAEINGYAEKIRLVPDPYTQSILAYNTNHQLIDPALLRDTATQLRQAQNIVEMEQAQILKPVFSQSLR